MVPFYEVLIIIRNVMHYMNHEHSQKDKIVRLNGWGSPKVSQGGRGGRQPKGFVVLFKYRNVRGNRGIFLVRFVKTYCKKNYFLLQ